MSNQSVDQLIQKLKKIRIQETQVLNQIEEARLRETTDSLHQVPIVHPGHNPFKKGDRVKISNKIRLPGGRTPTNDDRVAVVTDVVKDKVYFTTFNGTKTWRLYKNLRPN